MSIQEDAHEAVAQFHRMTHEEQVALMQRILNFMRMSEELVVEYIGDKNAHLRH